MLFYSCILLFIFSRGYSANVGFFAFYGPYSHDLLTNNLANALASETNHNVLIPQIRIFPYPVKVPFGQKHILCDYTVDRPPSKKLWLQRIWSLISSDKFENIAIKGTVAAMLEYEARCLGACLAVSKNFTFINRIRSLDLDFLAIDIFNHCATSLAKALKIPYCHITNFPFPVITDVGVPSNPAYVPLAFANFEPYELFYGRFINTGGYVLECLGTTFSTPYDGFFEMLRTTEFEQQSPLMIGSSWEMLVDTPRPVARNVRYFGCTTCWDSGKESSGLEVRGASLNLGIFAYIEVYHHKLCIYLGGYIGIPRNS